MATIGQNIKRLREAAGFKTQGALAKALEVPQPQVSDWENDRYLLLDTKTLLKVATALKCSVDALLAGVDAAYERAVRHNLQELQDALDRISDPDSSADDEERDDERRYDVRTVAELVAEITRDRDLASRAGAVRDAAAAFAMATTEDERLVLDAYRQAKQSALGLDGRETEPSARNRQAGVPASNTPTGAAAGLARAGATGTDTRSGRELVTAGVPPDGQTDPVASAEAVDVQGLVTDVLSRAAPRERERKAAARSREKPKRRQPARGTTRRRG